MALSDQNVWMSQSSERALAAIDRDAPADAVAIARHAANAQDADALYLLAQWHIGGRILPRDLSEARRLLRAASSGGHEDASLLEVSFAANGTGAAPDWGAALKFLRDAAARFGGPARDDIALIEAMDLDRDGNPNGLGTPETLGQGYVVRRWKQFLSPQECAHVAMSVTDLMGPSTVADPRTGKLIEHPIRSSSAAVVGPTRETLPILAILRRVAAATGTQVSQGEPLTLLHYAPGQQYRAHLDALPHESNQRIITALTYLNSGYSGGETHFPEQDLTIVPAGGDLIAFENALPDGTPDVRSRHAGRPLKQGTKWVATRWIRSRPLDVWSLG
jgi:prolyl 4-hydroxylase